MFPIMPCTVTDLRCSQILPYFRFKNNLSHPAVWFSFLFPFVILFVEFWPSSPVPVPIPCFGSFNFDYTNEPIEIEKIPMIVNLVAIDD